MTDRATILASEIRAIAAFARSALVALKNDDADSAIGDVKLILSLAEEPVPEDESPRSMNVG